VRTVSILIGLINEDLTTVTGILKGGETQHIQQGFEARTAQIIA